MAEISLSEYIFEIKRELMQRDPEDLVPLLAIDEIELEVAVTVTKEAQAGVKFWVIDLGGGGKKDDAQTVRVKMTPLLTHEERVKLLREQYPQFFEEKIIPKQLHTVKGDETSKDDE